jgi:hypothetical protein
MLLRNVDALPPDYTALRSRRQYSPDTKTFHDSFLTGLYTMMRNKDDRDTLRYTYIKAADM